MASPVAPRIWTRERVEEAFRAWAAEHDGFGPRHEDWSSGVNGGVHHRSAAGYPTVETVRKLYGMPFSQARARLGFSAPPKRVYRQPRQGGECPTCGRTVRRRAVYCDRRCQGLMEEARTLVRWMDAIWLRREGGTNLQIAQMLDRTAHQVAVDLSRAKAAGFPVPVSPYRVRSA